MRSCVVLFPHPSSTGCHDVLCIVQHRGFLFLYRLSLPDSAVQKSEAPKQGRNWFQNVGGGGTMGWVASKSSLFSWGVCGGRGCESPRKFLKFELFLGAL